MLERSRTFKENKLACKKKEFPTGIEIGALKSITRVTATKPRKINRRENKTKKSGPAQFEPQAFAVSTRCVISIPDD